MSKELGLAVGQAWRSKSGMVVVERMHATGFTVRKQWGFFQVYHVRADGSSMSHGSDLHDLIEKVERVYIAGPMSGHEDLNFPAFNAAADEYRKRGCFVINPAELNGGVEEIGQCARMDAEQYQAHWRKCMQRDIVELVSCDSIVMLKGWEKSKGATLEHHIAQQLGMTISYPIETFNKDQ